MTKPTWRAAIESAIADVRSAEARRDEIVRAALNAGLSVRQVAAVADVPTSRVLAWRGAMDSPDREALLDAPADIEGAGSD